MTGGTGEQREEMGEMAEREEKSDVTGEKQDGKMASKMAERDEMAMGERDEKTMSEMGEKSEREEMGEMTKREAGKMTEQDESKRTGEDALDGTSSDAWEELAEACLLAEDEEEASNEFYNQIVNGHIYLITNIVNGKQYVGQTVRTIEHRWKEHIRTAHSTSTQWKPLIDRAIAKYGVDAFAIKELEHLDNQPRYLLDRHECYWIRKYRTCILDFGKGCGYNIRRGGHSARSFFSVFEEQKILQVYAKSHNISAVARIFNVTPAVIRCILNKYHIAQFTDEERKEHMRKILGTRVLVTNEDSTIHREFASLRAAIAWLQNRYYINPDISVTSCITSIYQAIHDNRLLYGFMWSLPDLSIEEQEQRYQRIQEQRRRAHSRSHPRDIYSQNKRCIVCGRLITNQSTYCPHHTPTSHHGEGIGSEFSYLSNNVVRQELGLPLVLGGEEVDKAIIESLLRFHTIRDIAEIYDVSDTYIRKFIKKYFGIVSHRYQLYKLWNSQLECYEYYSQLPITLAEFQDHIVQGRTVVEIAQQFQVAASTFYQYLYKCFGKHCVQSILNMSPNHPSHRFFYDYQSNRYFANATELADYLIEAEHLDPKPRLRDNISRRIMRHLVHSQQSDYILYDHRICCVEQIPQA